MSVQHAAKPGLIPRDAIDRAAAMLLDAAPVGSEVILFGSYARGEATEHSDLDFMVIEPPLNGQIAEMTLGRSLALPDLSTCDCPVPDPGFSQLLAVFGRFK